MEGSRRRALSLAACCTKGAHRRRAAGLTRRMTSSARPAAGQRSGQLALPAVVVHQSASEKAEREGRAIVKKIRKPNVSSCSRRVSCCTEGGQRSKRKAKQVLHSGQVSGRCARCGETGGEKDDTGPLEQGKKGVRLRLSPLDHLRSLPPVRLPLRQPRTRKESIRSSPCTW